METHKEIFTRWLKNAPREGREIVYPFRDWVSDQNIIRCDVCGEYGHMGEEVTYLQDTDWCACLETCVVSVYGWYGPEGMYLEALAPIGQEVEFLLKESNRFGEKGLKDLLTEWGKINEVATNINRGCVPVTA